MGLSGKKWVYLVRSSRHHREYNSRVGVYSFRIQGFRGEILGIQAWSGNKQGFGAYLGWRVLGFQRVNVGFGQQP